MSTPSCLGPVMLDLRGPLLLAEETERLLHPATGGVILFSRNYESLPQLITLIEAVRKVRPELLIAVDHEGGRVQRFRNEFTRLPPASEYARHYGSDRSRLLASLQQAGWLMAAELRAIDVDFSFAPVLDVDSGISQIIGDRSFSQAAEEAGDCAQAFAAGMRQAGMAAVGKHFPGHGGVALDSHLALPEDHRSYDELAGKDLLPFCRLIQQGVEGIMPAHVVYTAIDPNPAGFSNFWIQQVLRDRLGFDGAVFSDDLSMAGAAFAGDYRERAQRALAAGCDMILVCNQPDAAGDVLESLGSNAISARQDRLVALRGRFPVRREELLGSGQWREAKSLIERINSNLEKS